MKEIAHFLFAVICFCHVSYAQQDSVSIQMDRLGKNDFVEINTANASTITSVSRNEKNIEDLPFTAYVVTQEMIVQRGYRTLVDVLKDLPGTRVSQPGSAIHGETFSFRGLFGNYYTKILLDNIPIQPSATNGMPLEAQIPLQSVERVEVIFGPAADVYGADAMAGVINIITKSSEKAKWGNATIELGSPDVAGFNFSIGGKFGKRHKVFKYLMYGGVRQMRNKNIIAGHANNYNPLIYASGDSSFVSDSSIYQGTFTHPDINGLPSNSLHAGARLSGKKLEIGFDVMERNEHSAIGLNPLFVLYDNPNEHVGERIYRGYGRYATKFGNWDSKTYLSWLSYRMNNSSSYSTILNPLGVSGQFYRYSASDDLYFEESMNYEWKSGLAFQTGVTFQYSGNFPIYNYLDRPYQTSNYQPWSRQIKNSPFLTDTLGIEPFNFTNTSIMAQFYYEHKKWEMMLGARFDYNSRYYGALNPRFGVSYKLKDDFILRASISTAFRPPSSYLIYSSYKSVATNNDTVLLPAPKFDLEPENLSSVEFGAKWLINKRSTLDFVMYNHLTRNSIVKTISVSGDEVFYGFQNSPDSRRGLFGAQIQYSVKESNQDRWYLDASVAFANGYEELPFGQGRLKELREMPRWIGKALIGYKPLNNLDIAIRNQFMSNWLSSSIFNADFQEAYRISGFYTLDLIVTYTVSDNIMLSLNVFNVTDAHYGGLSAINDLGVLTQNGIFTESMFYNPQYNARFNLSASIQF